jgi:hypothetical protein
MPKQDVISLVSNKLVDGYTDVYLYNKGQRDNFPLGVNHCPTGDGKRRFLKVQVKTTKGDVINAWQLIKE